MHISRLPELRTLGLNDVAYAKNEFALGDRGNGRTLIDSSEIATELTLLGHRTVVHGSVSNAMGNQPH
jgi:hypothetical protein